MWRDKGLTRRTMMTAAGAAGLGALAMGAKTRSARATEQAGATAGSPNVVIPLMWFTLQTGDVIALEADTGLYLSRINRGDTNPIEAAKKSMDPYSRFTVTVLDNSKVALQADTGLYLSRINRGDTNPIEAAKDNIDPYSQFRIILIQSSRRLG